MNAASAIRILALATARVEVRTTIKATLGSAALRTMPRAELERIAREALAPRHHIRAAGMWARAFAPRRCRTRNIRNAPRGAVPQVLLGCICPLQKEGRNDGAWLCKSVDDRPKPRLPTRHVEGRWLREDLGRKGHGQERPAPAVAAVAWQRDAR